MMDHSYMMIGLLVTVALDRFCLVCRCRDYPIGRILARLGYSPFWSILAFVPDRKSGGLWIVALGEWPADEANTR